MRPHWKWIIGFVVVLTLIQLIRPERTNPPVTPSETIHARLSVPPSIDTTFARSCNDCHSNLTVWPWYSSVAPVSWLVTYDVTKGREDLNFSEWSRYPGERQQELLKEICEKVSNREMPGAAYTRLHPSARLTNADMGEICTWTQSVHQGPQEDSE